MKSSAGACHLVNMGQIAFFSPPEIARSVLGSCIAVAIYDEHAPLAAMAHVVLPRSSGRDSSSPGKFADTAIAAMRNALIERGAIPRRLRAKIAGGASMFANKGPIQIGQQNIEAVRAGLELQSIRLAGEHLGGDKGRRVTFDAQTQKLLIEIAGSESIVL
jgi:chemotaxis protein CheD